MKCRNNTLLFSHVIFFSLSLCVPPAYAWNYVLWPMSDCFGSPVAGFVNCKIGDCCQGVGAVASWSARADSPPAGDTLRSMYISFWKSSTVCADKQDNQVSITSHVTTDTRFVFLHACGRSLYF
jgi:hypothetical protein